MIEIKDTDKHLYHWNEDGTVKLTRYNKPMKIRYKKGRNDAPDQIYTKTIKSKLMESPEFLLKEYLEYVTHMDNTPLLVHSVERGEDVYTKKTRALSVNSFDNWFFLRNKFKCIDYIINSRGNYKEYVEVGDFIRSNVRETLLENSLVGIYNSQIVSRVLGLVEKSETKTESTVQVKDRINIKFK